MSSEAPVPMEISADQKAKAEEFKSKGNDLFGQNHFKDAREAYSKAIECDPSNPVYFSNRAFCELKLEEFGSAILDAEAALKIDKTFIKAYYRRGAAHLYLSKYKEARNDFQQVLKLKPSDKDAAAKLKACEQAIFQQRFAAAIAGENKKPASETVDLNTVDVDASYEGPVYERGQKLDADWIASLMEHFKNQKRFHRRYAMALLLDGIQLFSKLPTLVDISVPEGNHFTVCGDVHGQYYDVLNLFKINGVPSESNPYLFNGDFVDRGSFSLEIIILFIALKLCYPNHFHMTRGNHETDNMNSIYGFKGEVLAKLDSVCYDLFTECFNHVPLAACIGKKVLVLHGGLFSQDGVKLDDIRKIDRTQQPPESGLMTELLWSDPQKAPGRAPSKRGVGLSFGPDVTERFLKDNGLELIVRSHEVKDDGYEFEHNNQLITVFSAPNYCDQMGNKGAYIRFESDLKPKCFTFESVPHPPIAPMAYVNRNLYGF